MSGPVAASVLAEHPLAGDPPRFELDSWHDLGLHAGITGRAGDLDLGLFAGGPAGRVLSNWLLFGRSQQPEFRAIAVARQVHGCRIQEHGGNPTGWLVDDGIDGHFTAQPGLLLAVTVADCIPVYLAHSESATVALLHAGWRGIAQGILEAGIRVLTGKGGCTASEIIMHCGAGICGECYEVGPEVITQVTGALAHQPGKLDLRAALAERAVRAGVREITVSSWCSSHDQELFFSHRRSGGKDGRMLAYLGVPESPM